MNLWRGECKDTVCEWPEVLMSGRNDASEDVCRCEPCTGIDPNDPYSCNGNPPTCTPKGCPSVWNLVVLPKVMKVEIV